MSKALGATPRAGFVQHTYVYAANGEAMQYLLNPTQADPYQNIRDANEPVMPYQYELKGKTLVGYPQKGTGKADGFNKKTWRVCVLSSPSFCTVSPRGSQEFSFNLNFHDTPQTENQSIGSCTWWSEGSGHFINSFG